MHITGGPDAPVITDGPFAEGAEVAGGYYVFEAENLDDALALARDIPAARYGAVEVWPMATARLATQPPAGNNWIALLLEPPERPVQPGSPEWEAMVVQHKNSRRSPVTTSSPAPVCIRRRRRPPCGCAMVKSFLLMGPMSKAPKWRTGSMS